MTPGPKSAPAAAPAVKTTSKRPARKTAAWSPTTRRAVAAVALDVVAEQLLPDVEDIGAPAGVSLADVFAWIGSGLPVRVERAHPDGRGGDGMVCLSASVLAAVKLPAKMPTTDKGWERVTAKLHKAAAGAGLELGEKVGPVFAAYRRRGGDGPRTSVRVVLVPWLGQAEGAQRAELPLALAGEELDALALARRVRAFVADVGVMPGNTTATTGWRLLDALRPRTAYEHDDAGKRVARPREGALPTGDCAVPVAAGGRHPLTRERQKARELICEEEDFKQWARPLSDIEAARPWAVAVDVCASFLSVTETLRLPAGELEFTASPTWSPKSAGLWLCDFTGLETERDLPHPATFTGLPPTGPGWYATPTVDYMVREYGYDPAAIGEAYVSRSTLPFLREWTTAIRGGYKRCMSVLGLVDGMDDVAFLAAHQEHKATGGDADKDDALVLAAAYKGIYKGGIGKWADKGTAQYPGTAEGNALWLEKIAGQWWYRPEVRHHILAAARIAAHRRMRKTYRLTGRAPFAVNVDSYLYAADAPSPLELLPRTEDGRPVPGALRLGAAPGSFKHESSVPMAAVAEAMGERLHPSRLTHDFTTAGRPVTTDSEV
ncbi:hypothetical protein OG693_39895 [Streptomyces sp. NBC_01259]|uniref:hypothetical protein n=1 Tax=Streptomyces sp. NBC_01259 TaxID=2903800 RepID=UPI00324D6785